MYIDLTIKMVELFRISKWYMFCYPTTQNMVQEYDFKCSIDSEKAKHQAMWTHQCHYFMLASPPTKRDIL